VFVLDTSPWSGVRDQRLNIGGREGVETRLASEVVSMKLLCSSWMPQRVGVVHMGASNASWGLEPTTHWRSTDDPGLVEENPALELGLLHRYGASSEPGPPPGAPDPRRISRALRLGLEALRAQDGWKQITVLLCSPLPGLGETEADLLAVLRELRENGVETDFVLHPSVYSPSFDQILKLQQESPTPSPESSGDEGGDRVDRIRSADGDVETLSSVFGLDLRNNLVQQNFVKTLALYGDQYFSGVSERANLLTNWSMCFPEFDPTQSMPHVVQMYPWLGTLSEPPPPEN